MRNITYFQFQTYKKKVIIKKLLTARLTTTTLLKIIFIKKRFLMCNIKLFNRNLLGFFGLFLIQVRNSTGTNVRGEYEQRFFTIL